MAFERQGIISLVNLHLEMYKRHKLEVEVVRASGSSVKVVSICVLGNDRAYVETQYCVETARFVIGQLVMPFLFGALNIT